MNIGLRIKERRKELKISVDELAKKLGKDRSTIYRYEKGDIENLPLDILEPIAKALHTSPQHLMGWDTKTEETQKKQTDHVLGEKEGGSRTMGDVIKSLRINRHLSLVEFSEEIGLPLKDLQQYENGSKQLSAKIINLIAHFFGLESSDIADRLLHLDDGNAELSFRKEYVEYIRGWNKEFGVDSFTPEEIKELFKYGHYLKWKRKNE